MKTYVLYHGNCPDGFGAAWAARCLLGDEDVDYIPVNYGQKMPEMEVGSTVFILDFSYPRQQLKDLAKRVSKLVVLDHHQTAQANLAGLDQELGDDNHLIYFDMNHSGAMLAWKYFNGFGSETSDERAPRMIQYLQDRDLWRFRLPHSREVSMWVRMVGFSGHPGKWDKLSAQMESEEGFQEIARHGHILLAFMATQVDVMCKNARIKEVGGVEMPVVNASCFFSEVGERLLELHPNYPVAGYYFDRDDKRQWGLRSRPGYDCSEIAKRCGGGGHAQSSGFTQPIP